MRCRMPKQTVKIIPCEADCTTSDVLNFRVTEPNLSKFPQGVQKLLPTALLKSKFAIFQSVCKRQRDEWRSSSNGGQIAAKIACFNSVNSKITWRKFTKFGHNVAWLLPLNLLKADLWSANPLSNAEAKSNGHSTRRLQTSPIFTWLP